MSSHLKKLGLSDTKFELKYHTPKCGSKLNAKESSSKPKPHPQPQPHDDSTVLDLLIELIARKQRECCGLQDHDRNQIKFLCLEENCPARTGCSYCFLDGHKGHTKIESRTCLKDLVDLQQRAQVSRGLLRSELLVRKQELLSKIEGEISIIREEFMSSLEYMTRKVREAIEAKFAESIKRFSREGGEGQYATIPDREDTFREADAERPCDDGSDIISKFMLSSCSRQCEPKPAIRSISKYPIRRDSAPPLVLSR
jgi:hypothetical protein